MYLYITRFRALTVKSAASFWRVFQRNMSICVETLALTVKMSSHVCHLSQTILLDQEYSPASSPEPLDIHQPSISIPSGLETIDPPGSSQNQSS